MPQTSQQKVSFNAGVISPLAALRLDLERAANGCRQLENFIPRAAGPIFKRPGTENLGRIKDDEPAVLKRFNYSVNTRFQLEFGAGYVRFWKDRAPVYLTPGAASTWSGTTTQYDIGTPVYEANVLYRAASTHTPSGANQPPSASWTTTNIEKWVASTAYSVGDLVINVFTIYVCKTGHTSGSTFSSTNWAQVNINSFWNTATAYAVGDKLINVVSGNWRAFRCTVAHTSAASTQPGVGASWTSRWENISTPPNHSTSSKVYVAGDAVKVSTTVYICNANHTSSTSNEPTDGGSPWSVLTGVTAWSGTSTARAVGDWTFYGNDIYRVKVAQTTGTYLTLATVNADEINVMTNSNIQAWTSSPTYLQNAVVSSGTNNALYLCIADHATATTTEPGTDGGIPYWQRLQNLYLWATGTNYSAGQFVVNSTSVYRVVSDHLSGTFSTDLSNGLLVLDSYPLELPTPYVADDLDKLNPVGINDQVWLLHPDKETRLLERFGDSAWRIGSITWDFPPMRDENVEDTHTLAVSATTGTGVTLTSSAKLFDAGMVNGYFQIAHRRDQSTSKLVFSADGNSPALRFNGRLDVFLYGTAWKGDVFLEFSKDGSTNWQVQRSWTQPVANMRTISTFVTVEEETFARLRFDRDGAGGTSDYGIIEAADSRVVGLVKVKQVLSSTVATVDVVKDVWSTATTTLWAEGAYSDYRGWPRAGTVHEQRLYLVGTKDEAEKIRGSQVDGFFNFTTNVNDDSAVAFVAASRESNALMWAESFGKALVMGSIAEEWSARNYDQSTISPSNPPRVERETRMGSAPISAVLLGDALIFVSTDQRKVVEFSYSFADEKHIKQDMTQLSEHLFNAGIKQIAVARTPDPVLYCVMKDGGLLSFTYDRNQNVAAWAKHSTGTGLFESVSVVYGGTDGVDEVWFIVNRGGKRFVEAYHQDTANYTFAGTEDELCYCDCSVLVTGAPATTVSGLDDYEGMAVAVLADGKVVTGKTVSSGQITLSTAASVVRVGIPYTATYQGMWLDLQLQDGSAQDKFQRAAQITVFLHNSNGVEYNPDPLDSNTWYGEGIGERTDVGARDTRPTRYTVTNPARHGYETNLTLRSNDPLPVNILGIIYLNEFFG